MVKSILEVYLEIARTNPKWTADEEKAFIASCTTKRGRWKSNAAKERFVNEAMKHNLGLVFSIVNKMSFNKNEDVVQKAIVGMVEALKKYDPKKGRKISTWITNPIKWAVMQYQNTYAKKYGGVYDEISALNRKFKMKMSVVSIDMPIGGDESNDTISNIISTNSLNRNYIIDKNFKSDDELQSEMDIGEAFHEMMEKMSKTLNEKETYIIKGLLLGKTQTDISSELHLSKVRISQLQASAFSKIRNSPMAGYLKRLLK